MSPRSDYYALVGRMSGAYARETDRRLRAVRALVAMAQATASVLPESMSDYDPEVIEVIRTQINFGTSLVMSSMACLMPDPPSIPLGIADIPDWLTGMLDTVESQHRLTAMLDIDMFDHQHQPRPSHEVAADVRAIKVTLDDAGIDSGPVELSDTLKDMLSDLFKGESF